MLKRPRKHLIATAAEPLNVYVRYIKELDYGYKVVFSERLDQWLSAFPVGSGGEWNNHRLVFRGVWSITDLTRILNTVEPMENCLIRWSPDLKIIKKGGMRQVEYVHKSLNSNFIRLDNPVNWGSVKIEFAY